MGEENHTYVTEFVFLGLAQDPQTQELLFVLFLIIYLLTVLGNLLIIVLFHINFRLNTPRYFFLRNLSFADLCFSITTVSQVLVHFLVKRKTLSFAGCSVQMVVLLLVGSTQCALLAVMSYDQYVGVCHPLHYSTIMTHWVCVQLALGPWATWTVGSLVDSTFTLYHQNKGNKQITIFVNLLKLASADTYNAEMAVIVMGVVNLLAPVSLILVSYGNIISTVIQMQTGERRLKVLSTCGSHLTILVLCYGLAIFAYMLLNSKTMYEREKMISVFYSAVTRLLNSIIYSLRNKDVTGALRE